MLDLGGDPPEGLPAPVKLWPATRPPVRVQVFGYPLAERSLNGVWREFTVAGPATAGAVQLDWIANAGTFPGHSGGPVVDAEGHALAGILVEGSEQGRFERFLPTALIAQVWPELPQRWLITGAAQADSRNHFALRARGQRGTTRGGDLFRGRRAALAAIREWLTSTSPPSRPLVVTGQPGAGKSATLARAVLGLEKEYGVPGLAFHARAATISDFLTAVADLTGAELPTSAEELVDKLSDLRGQPLIRVAVDALDEAASDADRFQIATAVAELAMLPWLRVVVSTRTLAVHNRFAPGHLLPILNITSADSPNLIDLDTDTYFEPDGLREFAAAVLAQEGANWPGPWGGMGDLPCGSQVAWPPSLHYQRTGWKELPGRCNDGHPIVGVSQRY